MNRRTDEIKKIQQKVSPGVPGKILPGGLSGTAHEEAEDHKHQQYFDIKLNKVIKHTDSLVENMAYHIINMRVLQESLLFYQTKTEKCDRNFRNLRLLRHRIILKFQRELYKIST